MTSAPLTGWQPPPTAPPVHSQARTAMVLGNISIFPGALLLLPVLAGPFAWYFGAAARREIEREPTRWGGRGEATTGMILGIIATALLALILLVAALAVGGYALLLNPQIGYGS